MAIAMDRHSRLVAWLKILLPIVALGMLATIFLVSRAVDPSQTIPYADVDVQDLARTQAIRGATYAGITDDGASVRFSADAVRPENGDPDHLLADRPDALIDLPTGQKIEMSARTGTLNQTEGLARLDGGVTVTTSDGYHIVTEALDARLDASRIASDGAVKGTGPLGDLDAGAAVMTRQEDGSYVLRFEKGVNLVYRPQQ